MISEDGFLDPTVSYKDMSLEELLCRLRLVRVQQSILGKHQDSWLDKEKELLRKEALALKTELAQRPHVPRRLEKLAARRQAAKVSRGQGKSKDK